MIIDMEINGVEARDVLVRVLMTEFLADRDARDDLRTGLEILQAATDAELLATVRQALNRRNVLENTYYLSLRGSLNGNRV